MESIHPGYQPFTRKYIPTRTLVLVVIDYFTRYTEASLPNQEPKIVACKLVNVFSLGSHCHNSYIMIKGSNLNQSCSKKLPPCCKLRKLVQALTTLMTWWKGLAVPYWLCCLQHWANTRGSGRIISVNCVMHTTQVCTHNQLHSILLLFGC